MAFVQLVSIIAILDAIRAHFIISVPPPVQLAIEVFGLATLIAIILFCGAMRSFCVEARLYNPAQSWEVTSFLFFVIYLLPLGLSYLLGIWAIAFNPSLDVEFGPIGLLIIPLFVIFLVPLIHFFVSTSRMKRAAEDVLPPDV